MSELTENLLFRYAAKKYQQAQAADTGQKRGATSETYWRWQYDTSARLFEHYKGLNIAGKDVLDIGCGIGGRTCYLATMGPAKIIGCDINHAEIDTACTLKDQFAAGLGNVEFCTKRVGSDELAPESFDVALIVDAMEHVEQPGEMLRDVYELLRPGGWMFFGTIGWGNWAASHITNFIPLPFVQLLFSDTTILNVIRRMLQEPWYKPSQWDSDPPISRWQHVSNLKDRPGEHLNKYTIKKFEQALATAPFSHSEVQVVGFSEARGLMSRFNFLTRVPLAREVWHSYLVGAARK